MCGPWEGIRGRLFLNDCTVFVQDILYLADHCTKYSIFCINVIYFI